MVVTRAGPPSTGSYVFAFVFPMSLLIGTIFTSMRIAEKLDRQYLEEVRTVTLSRFSVELENSNWLNYAH